jgi:cytochrome c556
MRFLIAATPLIALALASCGNPDTPGGRAADARHESFEEMGEALKTIGDELGNAEPNRTAIGAAADTINTLAPKLSSWFPVGSGPADGMRTHALQDVWTKPVEFKLAAEKFVAEAGRFHAAVKSGDLAVVGAGMKSLGETCKGCHDKFREAE